MWRLDYRFRASMSLRDQRRVHVGCASRLPLGTRRSDLLIVQHWAGADGVGVEELQVLDNLLDILRPPSGEAASGSGGPAAG